MTYGEVAYLCLGSNLGDREAAIRRAVALLRRLVSVELCSAIYETEPWGHQDQPPFLNMVCRVRSRLNPRELLETLKKIEVKVGRVASFQRYGPRLIDVDILFYGDLVISTPELSIPHPRLAERAFVLVPMAEVDPFLRHPALGQTVRQFLDALGLETGVRLWGPPPC